MNSRGIPQFQKPAHGTRSFGRQRFERPDFAQNTAPHLRSVLTKFRQSNIGQLRQRLNPLEIEIDRVIPRGHFRRQPASPVDALRAGRLATSFRQLRRRHCCHPQPPDQMKCVALAPQLPFQRLQWHCQGRVIRIGVFKPGQSIGKAPGADMAQNRGMQNIVRPLGKYP